MKRAFNDSVSVTLEGEAYLDDFDEEAVVEYVRRLGYSVGAKGDPESSPEKYPIAASPKTYRDEFCKLNGITLKP